MLRWVRRVRLCVLALFVAPPEGGISVIFLLHLTTGARPSQPHP